ncbi:MAG: hypothetical protein R2724_07140 [Bryobacterales bacterium]
MTIEDAWGGTSPGHRHRCIGAQHAARVLFTSTDFNSYVTVSTAEGAPQREWPHGRAGSPGSESSRAWTSSAGPLFVAS